MPMTLFFTDLDNTVIYSHRHKTEKPVVWVEYLNGRRQSYMTQRSFDFFRRQQWLDVVPVTTRTSEQYSRLGDLASELNWREALICNGSILLRDGREDPVWRAESVELSRAEQPAFKSICDRVREQYPEESVVMVDQIMFYIRAADKAEETYRSLLCIADGAGVLVYRDARKVYCMPASLNKGTAVARYKRRRGEAFSTAAGDSAFDISMLEQADVCICPEALCSLVKTAGQKIACKDQFGDSICDELAKIHRGFATND